LATHYYLIKITSHCFNKKNIMKSRSKIMAVMMLLVSLLYTAQIKNAKTETVKISGNCDMCKSKIEKSGNV